MADPKLDLRTLEEDSDPLEIARALGVKIYPKGNRNFICCPGHKNRLGREDLNPTNAVLTEKGYHCFACGVSVGIIDMVREITGYSFKEAVNFLASFNGGAELYKEGLLPEKHLRLSEEELEALNMDPLYGEQISLTDALLTNEKMMKDLILERISKMLSTYQTLKEKYQGDDGAMKLYEFAGISQSKRHDMLEEIDRRTKVLENLRKNVT